MGRRSVALLPSACLSYSFYTRALGEVLSGSPGTPGFHVASVRGGPERFQHAVGVVMSWVGS